MKEKSIRNKKKTKKIIRNVIFWLLVAAFLGWFASLRITLENNPEAYDYVIPFESRPLNEYRTAGGKIVMNDIETVSTDVTQKIKNVYFKLGDIVNEGDVLCEFESEDLEEQIRITEKYINERKALENLENNNETGSADYRKQLSALNVESASMAVVAARKAYDDTYAKYSEYFDKCYGTSDPAESQMYYNMYTQYQSQLDGINEQIIASQKAYDQAVEAANKMSEAQNSSDYIKTLTGSELEEYEKQLEKLKNEREHLVVTAPKSGIIADCYVSEGGYAFDGGLFRIGTLGSYKVEAFVESRDILDIEAGMDASFKTTLTGSDEITAKLTKVSDFYSSADGGYAVELEITDKSVMDKLRHNVFTSVKIYTVNLGTLPAVQYDAIAEDEDGSCYVYKAVKKGSDYVAEKVAVEKGYESDFYVEVSSDDLREGDFIVGNAREHKSGDHLKIKGMAG